MEPGPAPGTAVDVEELTVHIAQIASRQQLAVVPAKPVPGAGLGVSVMLGAGDLSAADFCELARVAGAKLLYVMASHFDAENEPGLDAIDDECGASPAMVYAQTAELRRYAQQFNGRICSLELAFTDGGVLHCWTAAADWYEDIADRIADLYEIG
jgi:hypothetical protein